ncbi:MAG: YidC/Oxa1 family insertase periplasmic-domain containing protein, partial [Phycisphaerae bacterium]
RETETGPTAEMTPPSQGVLRPTSAAPVEPGQAQPGETLDAVEAEKEQTLFMGSAPTNGVDKKAPPSPYRMRLTLSNVGSTIESATMTDHAADLGSDERYGLLSPVPRDDGTLYRSLAVEWINVDGIDLALHDKKWHAEEVEETQEGQRVTFWITIRKDDADALKLTHTFTLPRQGKKLGRHDLESNITVKNLSDQPHHVIVTYGGGIGVKREYSRMDDRYVDWGLYDGTRVAGTRKAQSAVTKSAGPVQLYEPSAGDPRTRLSWAATANTYFTCTIAPLKHDRTDNATYLAEVAALDADGSAFTDDDATLQFVTMAESLEPGKTLSYPAAVYLGEKDADAFRNVEDYGKRNYYYQISQGFGWCTFTWLVELMIWLLNGLFLIAHDYGVAIIVLVLVARALLHPITKKGQVNMVRMQQRMQDLAPKIEEIKKKYANDKARLNQEMMKLNINPAGQLVTCLPMMIQMPIWIALYLSLSNNILMRHEPALYGLTWVKDLTAPDALYTFSSPIHVPLLGWEILAFNLLPILVSVFMYTQQKLQPKPKPNPNATEQQRQQQEMMQKMMPMMSIMMLLIFYKMPSGLNLYIMSSSLFGTIEQYLIRKHIKQREAAGTLHKPDKKKGGDQAAQPRKPGKVSFFQRLQQMAGEAQKAQAKRPAKSKSRR